MLPKILLALLVAVTVTGNPAVNQPWHWIHRRVTVSPNLKAAPFDAVVRSVIPLKPKYPSGTVRVDCSYGTSEDSKIVGGFEVAPYSYPWQIAIYMDNIFFCGGSIISEDWVMTAAHCLQDIKHVQVVAGAFDLTVDEPSQVSMKSSEFIIHEDYSPALLHNDIALIKLPNKLVFNDYIQPICLPSGDDIGDGVVVTPSGWGKNHDDVIKVSSTLHAVKVPTITYNECTVHYGAMYVTEKTICTDGSNAKGTCYGDSGGPLNYKTGGITETRGIVSFGSSAGCEAGEPDAYTRVSHYLGWIQDNTGVTV